VTIKGGVIGNMIKIITLISKVIEKLTVRIDILDPITAEEAQRKSMKGKRVLKITINAIEREVKLVAIALSKANPNLGLATI
jgi:hypothetical protein